MNNYTFIKDNNSIIRTALRENKVYLWELAYILGVSESTVMRWMGKDHSEEEQLHIAEMILEYAKNRKREVE